MISVSQLNEQIKGVLEATFMDVLVEGEVSRVTYHSSGHLYFTLKDEESLIKCVMWRGNVKKLKFELEDGMHIVVSGYVGVYTPRGEYQIICSNIEPFGKGSLALAFEQLKEKLQKKGYFDKSKKKPLPPFPTKIAVVSAKNSAAVADILKVAQKRWPLVEIIIVDSLVQGEGSKEEIVKAIKYANSLKADLILLARGGGSIEDLWSFNEEEVAKAIYQANTPIVSAIGHEIDYVISDFVADLRAPTPSAAVEIILPDINELYYKLDELREKLYQFIMQKIIKVENEINFMIVSLKNLSPSLKIEQFIKEFEILKKELNNQISFIISKKESELITLKEQFELNKPSKKIKEGLVEVIKDNKRVNLCSLKKGDIIELVTLDCIATAQIKDIS